MTHRVAKKGHLKKGLAKSKSANEVLKNTFFLEFYKKEKTFRTVNTALIIKEHHHSRGSVRALSLENGYKEKYGVG